MEDTTNGSQITSTANHEGMKVRVTASSILY
jgi:hypothetical protein